MLKCFTILLIAAQSVSFAGTEEAEERKLVYKFDMRTEVMPALWRQTQQAFTEAEELQADYILIHMNTYGGLVQAADSIRTKILNTDIPVIVFIDNNAISAGALIAIAAQEIYMRSGSSIGAATVVDATGAEVPDKFQSFMRSAMRATAESHGRDTLITESDTIVKWRRDPVIAEAMVDPSVYIPNIIDTGKVLTLTAEEAIEAGYCEGIASTISEVLQKAGIENYEIIEYELTAMESVIGFLIHPVFQSILIMIIIGGLYFELQTPGIGFPLGMAFLAAILYFAPLYLEGIAQNWEIALFIIGVILLAIEIFAIPGFGVAGIAGLVLMVTGLTLAMIDNIVWEFEGAGLRPFIRSLLLVIFSSFVALVTSISVSRRLLDTTVFSHLVLSSIQDKEQGYIGVDNKSRELVGKQGTASTSLRPSGRVEVESEQYDAKSLVGFIDKGEKVKVVKFETGQIYVVKEI
ncbi:MAG: nodulation protein NfeD [Marinilabiliales bacterium]|nr:MAG: nodulation protein NfeD [Marinilabiliales bacterium]